MQCKFCGQKGKLVKAHVIPEAFARRLRDGQRPPMLVNTDDGLPTKRSPIGVYDKEMLCEACEPKFCDWDTYGVELLLHRIDKFSELAHQGDVIARVLNNYDYDLLKLFFLSVLWRASVSNQPYYQKVSLGPHGAKIWNRLNNNDPGRVDDYSVVLSIFESKRNLGNAMKTMLDPYPERWDGVNTFRFYFGGIVAYIKVDKRPFGKDLRGIAIKPCSRLIIVVRDFDTSNDLKAITKVAQRLVV